MLDLKQLNNLAALETEMNDSHETAMQVIDFMSEPSRTTTGLNIEVSIELFNGKQALYSGKINHKPMAIVAEYDRGKGKYLLPYGFQIAFDLDDTKDEFGSLDFIGYLVKKINENPMYKQLL